MDMYFILSIIIHPILFMLFKLFQLWPLAALSVPSCVPFMYSHYRVSPLLFFYFSAPSYLLALQDAEGTSYILLTLSQHQPIFQ